MGVLCLRHCVQQLIHEVQAKVAVLQQYPRALHSTRCTVHVSLAECRGSSTHCGHALLQQSAGMHLLALAHGDGMALQTQLLGQCLNIVGWVGAHGQEADKRRARCTLTPHGLQVKDDSLCIPFPHDVTDVPPCLCQCAVRTPAPADTHTHTPHTLALGTVHVYYLMSSSFLKESREMW